MVDKKQLGSFVAIALILAWVKLATGMYLLELIDVLLPDLF